MTYYEMLNLAPAASPTEIEAALDERYNQWRPLVTHHDPKIQLQAQQALQNLERVRGTLSDPTRRADYDAGIGIGVSGLTDPTALFQSLQVGPGTPTPPPPSGPMSAATGARGATGLWSCPKCQADNPPTTKFCFKCGTQLVRACPECKSETSLIATGMCGNCGYHIDAATRREEIRQLLAQLTKQVAVVTPDYEELVAKSNTAAGFWYICLAIGAIVVLVGLIPGNGGALVVGLIPLALGIVGIIYGVPAARRAKTEATNLGEVLEKSRDQIKRLQAELGSPQLNRS